jgi:hypothetical protein
MPESRTIQGEMLTSLRDGCGIYQTFRDRSTPGRFPERSRDLLVDALAVFQYPSGWGLVRYLLSGRVLEAGTDRCLHG